MKTFKAKRQLDIFPKRSRSYGGTLLKKAAGRKYARPISTSQSMHLVLRSSKAVGEQSFLTSRNKRKIEEIIVKFSTKYGLKILSLANVGNHLHFHVRITKRQGYIRFIRAITAAIAMHITGNNRWSKSLKKEKFWDYRPFTRIVEGFRAFLNLKYYVQINQLEGLGVQRSAAYFLIERAPPREALLKRPI